MKTCRNARGDWVCTLNEGHDGAHEARTGLGRLCASWPRALVCESCRRVFNTERALEDHRSRVGTSFDDCNGHLSEHAKENSEKVQRVLESGALVIGVCVEEKSGCVFKLEGRLPDQNGDHFWSATLIAKPPKTGGSIGMVYAKPEREILESARIVAEPPKIVLPETRFKADLGDECGKLRHQRDALAAQLRVSADALSDVMAWLGPTKVREFERWREKTRK